MRPKTKIPGQEFINCRLAIGGAIRSVGSSLSALSVGSKTDDERVALRIILGSSAS